MVDLLLHSSFLSPGIGPKLNVYDLATGKAVLVEYVLDGVRIHGIRHLPCGDSILLVLHGGGIAKVGAET